MGRGRGASGQGLGARAGASGSLRRPMDVRSNKPQTTDHKHRYWAAALAALGLMLIRSELARAESLFWLQTDGSTSQLGHVTNPTLHVEAGKTVPVYLWFNHDSAPLGFDGVSLKVKLLSSDGGAAQATITIDAPPGRWGGITDGVTRSDSGGQGIDDCNAFDLTNTNTLPTGASRFGALRITGVTRGTVQLFLAVGQMGIADSGQNAVVWFGFAPGQFTPENLGLSGGVPNLASRVPEATINIVPKVGDFDGDGDVDQEDFGAFQACMTGSYVPQNDPACDEAKLAGHDHVDQDDFTIFAACMSGADIPVDYTCIP